MGSRIVELIANGEAQSEGGSDIASRIQSKMNFGDVFGDCDRRDELGALENKRARDDRRKVRAIVGEESNLREFAGDRRIYGAEAGGEPFA